MKFFTHRVWPGFLALLCLLSGMSAIIPLPVMEGRASAASYPDLCIESITWLPENPSAGNQLYFYVKVKNQGGENAAGCSLLFFIDNEFLSSDVTSIITPGNSETHIFGWKAKAGSHVVKAIIDSGEAVTESDENNNEMSHAFSVLAPDFIIDSITWTPEKPSAGDAIAFTIKVKNQGSKAGFGWVEFLIDGATRGQRAGQSIGPGESFTLNYNWIAQPGQHLLTASADVLNHCAESDEANNDLNVVYGTTPPDLIVDSITWSPVNRTETGNVTMSVTVKNTGEGVAGGSWINYYIDSKLESSAYITALEPNATATRTYNWQPGPEQHVFTATTDANERVIEREESNNTRSVTLPPLGLPDLAIQDITWSPAVPATNSPITFTVAVRNAGARAANGFLLDFYAMGFRFNERINSLAGGSAVNISFNTITSIGAINTRAIADPENCITELNENNNELAKSLTPKSPTPVADLTITSLTCTPSNPSPGEDVTIKAVIKNLGTGLSGTSQVIAYLDGDALDSAYFGELASGATTERLLLWKALTGKHSIRVAVDPLDSVFETSESNNEATATVSTVAPDLAIEKIEWFPVNPVPGNNVQFTVTIKNQGDSPSGPCYVTYYIDELAQGKHYLDTLAAGASVTRSFSWNMQLAFHIFKAALDQANAVIENDENNNEKTVSIPAPNLTIDGITCSEDYPAAGTTLTFTVKIKNSGLGTSTPAPVASYIDSNPLANVETGALKPADSSESVFTWVATPGKHTIHVIADNGNTVSESNESDNTRDIIIFVPLPSAPAATTTTTAAVPAVIPTVPPATSTPAAATVKPSATSTQTAQNTPKETSKTTKAPDVSGNISATDPASSKGIVDIIKNKWLLAGVAAAGVAAIAVLLILRSRAKNPKQPKAPKPPKPPKAGKQPKPVVKPAKPAPVKPGETLSGKPAVLVPPPPKPVIKPGIGPVAGPTLGASLLKQTAPPPVKPVQPPQNPPPVK